MIGAIELQPDDGPRSSLGIGPGSEDVVGSRRHSLGDSPKGSGSSLGTRTGDHRKKTERLATRLPEATGLVGAGRLNRPDLEIWVLRAVEPPRASG
ncbi:hypothetical protein B296_00054889 [Ensete ventricosum]|uniref:Uncharacterized protein n=1 Tax=Ensete ventricosum TaxID=4639 RepID=A0A426X3Q1_ENSVE|nr:hypothetical protein B296_00054889 [Ensete ventricosum]